jgi:hypothetical protein
MELVIGLITFLATFLMWALGNLAWILTVANFLWLLVRGVTLFSWWVPVLCAIGFAICVAIIIAVVIIAQD